MKSATLVQLLASLGVFSTATVASPFKNSSCELLTMASNLRADNVKAQFHRISSSSTTASFQTLLPSQTALKFLPQKTGIAVEHNFQP